jgi:NAD(P)H dehydrogenase (quinone)
MFWQPRVLDDHDELDASIARGGADRCALVADAERRLLADADVFAFIYPFWMNAQPAMFKGYIDRVFGMGFAYGSGRGGNIPLLKSRKMMSITSSGAPMQWVQKSGAWDAACKLFDEHFAAVCGLEVLEHIHFGGIHPGMRPDAVETLLGRVRTAVTERFAGSAPATAPVLLQAP